MRNALLLLSFAWLLDVVASELILLQQLSRHGSRAPEKHYQKVCPGDPWRWKWDVADAMLTGPGDLEEAAIGNVTRREYGTFIGNHNGTKHYVRSIDSNRVLQSAEVAMSTLFPLGFGPKGGLPGRPTFVPIHSVGESEDDLLNAPPAACYDRADADYAAWWNTTGQGILELGRHAITPVEGFCGRNASSSSDVKNMVDGVGFDKAEGFLTTELTDAEIYQAQNLSMRLQDGVFATDAGQTYQAGSLPATLLSNMQTSIAKNGVPSYVAYFSHRHALYGLAEFFGWQWHQNGIPTGMIHTGSTVFIELHRGDAGQYQVQLKQWNPHCGKPVYSDCQPEPIALPGCGVACSLDEFAQLIQTRTGRTGDWEKLCGASRAREVVVAQ